MYGAAVALLILQQPDKARLQLKDINNIVWTMQVCSVVFAGTFLSSAVHQEH